MGLQWLTLQISTYLFPPGYTLANFTVIVQEEWSCTPILTFLLE